MPADATQSALPEGTFDRAMHAHLEVIEQRIRRLYLRSRALFAEAIVAALVDGTLVEFPGVGRGDASAASPPPSADSGQVLRRASATVARQAAAGELGKAEGTEVCEGL
jgi:hypothetical protein